MCVWGGGYCCCFKMCLDNVELPEKGTQGHILRSIPIPFFLPIPVNERTEQNLMMPNIFLLIMIVPTVPGMCQNLRFCVR